jgi:hypothetical protein
VTLEATLENYNRSRGVFAAGIKQLAVADQNAQPAGIEEGLVHAGIGS